MDSNRHHRAERGPAVRAGLARIVLTAILATSLVTACDVHGISAPGTLATLTITPNPKTLAIGTAQQFVAVGTDADGRVVDVTPVWSVGAGGGAITAGGLFTANNTPGTYTNTVTATSGALTATATVIVVAGPLASITVAPNPGTMAIGGTQQYTAVGKDAGGNVVPFTPSWAVVAGGGSIDPVTGLFTAGQTAGTYTNTVRASSGAIAGTATAVVTTGPLATITVTPNPATMAINGTQQFTAVGKDAGGNVVAITPTWTVVNGGGLITATTGFFTAGTVTGTFTNTVRATVGAVAGSATVVVTPGPLASITVTPNPVTVLAGGQQQFTAVGRDASGNIVAIVPTWAASAGGTIDSGNGLFTAGATPGTYPNNVSATSGGVTGFATVTVSATAPVLTTITVTPNPVTVQTGGQQQFTATGRDQNGNIFLFTPTWSVVAGGGAINATGLFTAGNTTGTFTNTVQATSGAVSGNATVTVTAAPAPSVINLGTAAPNGIMAGTAFTCVIGGTINANIAISPGSTVTGFPPCVITGVQHLNDAVAIQAQIDLTAAYNQLAGLPCGTAIAKNAPV